LKPTPVRATPSPAHSAHVARVAQANTSKAAAPSAVPTAWRCRRCCDERTGMS